MTDTAGKHETGEAVLGEHADFTTMSIAGQMFGIPVLSVQDVLGTQNIARIPLSPSDVAGALNLRGRIVTAIDVRCRLGLPPAPEDVQGMSVVVEIAGELYSLIVDAVGEVLSLPTDSFERSPATLDEAWRDVSRGIYRLDNTLLVVLDVNKLLDVRHAEAA